MKKAIIPGSFDPITMGHVDIIERSSKLFDEVIVVILENSEKSTLFTLEERLTFIQNNICHLKNVRCTYDDSLTVSFAKRMNACAIIRGIRSLKDYEYEMDLASVNKHLDPSIETVLLYTAPQYAFVSSTIIKEMVKYHQDVSSFVSDDVCKALEQKMR